MLLQLRTRPLPRPRTTWPTTCAVLAALGLACTSPPALAGEPPFEITAAAERGVLEAGATQRIHLRISITGVRGKSDTQRAPMNVALVIDRSGSMQGARIDGARKAALAAIDRLSPHDIVSVVSYDDKVEVHVPATRASNKAAIKEKIAAITPRGSTAIWAGMQAGADEVRKFYAKDSVNRIILLSDGLANVGPSTPADFIRLGKQLASEGITVSTVGLGLGYNEDLMAKLAASTDGSHAFIQEPADLTGFLNREFDTAQSVVAQELEIRIRCLPGVKPIRSLKREARVEGQSIVYTVGQIADGVEQVLIAEVEVAAGTDGTAEIAAIDVAYTDLTNGRRETAATSLRAGIGSAARSQASLDPVVARDVTVLIAREQRDEAMRLRDAGRVEEAQKKFRANEAFVVEQQRKLPNAAAYEPLQREVGANRSGAQATTASDWDKSRKVQHDISAINSTVSRTT